MYHHYIFFRVFVKIFSDPKVVGDWVNKYDILIGFLYLLIRFTHYILQRKTTQYLNDVGNKSSVELNNLIYDSTSKNDIYIANKKRENL